MSASPITLVSEPSTPTSRPLRVIISGGGTGGHIYPAVAIANELRARQPDCEILFVGALGRMEMMRVPEAGYEIRGLRVAGFQRRLTLQNLAFPFKLIGAVREARRIVRDFAPDVVVGVGNIYACEVLFRSGIRPTTRAARISRARVLRLHDAIGQVLTLAVQQGGSTLRDFSNAHGDAGHFQLQASVYGRAGQPCRTCSQSIQLIRQGQRSTYYCRRCQT